MGNEGRLKRIKLHVIELVKLTGCWEHECHIGDAVENMAKFCIERKKEVVKWMEKNKKKNQLKI